MRLLVFFSNTAATEIYTLSLHDALPIFIIIGILAAIAIPVFLNQRKKGYDAQVKSRPQDHTTEVQSPLTDKSNNHTANKASLTTAGWKSSTGDTFKISIAAATGYCIVGT